MPNPKIHSQKKKTFEFLRKARSQYDEFVLGNVDHEFGRLFEKLEAAGILEDTWLVFTSDHGEFFERGIWGIPRAPFINPLCAYR
ncbi:MAG: sulfatase-like hydrolase/transferase [Anaerolineales bacterium]|nr:sulfatase-like hydrolase/transferase [Anaerolineales bacterium]